MWEYNVVFVSLWLVFNYQAHTFFSFIYIPLYFYFLTIAKYVLQDGSVTDSCYLCISLRENTNRTGSQRSVFDLDEGTWFVCIKYFHFC